MAFSAAMEKKTVRAMILMYCNDHHSSNDYLCSSCQEVEQYALIRIDKCPFGDFKPVCSTCRVHCYQPAMRERMQTIMKYSGPRMMTRHPILAIRYLYRKKFKTKAS